MNETYDPATFLLSLSLCTQREPHAKQSVVDSSSSLWIETWHIDLADGEWNDCSHSDALSLAFVAPIVLVMSVTYSS